MDRARPEQRPEGGDADAAKRDNRGDRGEREDACKDGDGANPAVGRGGEGGGGAVRAWVR